MLECIQESGGGQHLGVLFLSGILLLDPTHHSQRNPPCVLRSRHIIYTLKFFYLLLFSSFINGELRSSHTRAVPLMRHVLRDNTDSGSLSSVIKKRQHLGTTS